MQITLQLFAAARDLAGTDRVELELPEDADAELVRRRLADTYPALTDLLPHCHLAINEQYAAANYKIQSGDTIACIPPVSGG